MSLNHRKQRSYRRLRNYLRSRMNNSPNLDYTFVSLPPSTTSDSDSPMQYNDQSLGPVISRFTWPPKRFLRQLRAANQPPVRKNTRKVFTSSSSSSSSSSDSSDDSSVVIIEPEENLPAICRVKTSPKVVENGTPGKGGASFSDRAVKLNFNQNRHMAPVPSNLGPIFGESSSSSSSTSSSDEQQIQKTPQAANGTNSNRRAIVPVRTFTRPLKTGTENGKDPRAKNPQERHKTYADGGPRPIGFPIHSKGRPAVNYQGPRPMVGHHAAVSSSSSSSSSSDSSDDDVISVTNTKLSKALVEKPSKNGAVNGLNGTPDEESPENSELNVEIIEEWKEKSSQELSNNFEQALQSGTFADVILSVEGQKFSAHKMILAIRSNYFRDLFYGDKATSDPEVVLADTTAENFKDILLYVYSGKIQIGMPTLNRAIQLANSAQLFELSIFFQYVVDLLKKMKMDTANFAALLSFAVNSKLDAVLSRCRKYASKNLKVICESQEFCDMLLVELEQLFVPKLWDLNATKDQLLAQAMIRWIDVHPEQEESVQNLMSKFEMRLMRNGESWEIFRKLCEMPATKRARIETVE
ncbi:BTB/POZ domain-containing protein [Ditylenchus destructor]|nr:BTB/POZ domain-containing protein [Ditylenchus destructor]